MSSMGYQPILPWARVGNVQVCHPPPYRISKRDWRRLRGSFHTIVSVTNGVGVHAKGGRTLFTPEKALQLVLDALCRAAVACTGLESRAPRIAP